MLKMQAAHPWDENVLNADWQRYGRGALETQNLPTLLPTCQLNGICGLSSFVAVRLGEVLIVLPTNSSDSILAEQLKRLATYGPR